MKMFKKIGLVAIMAIGVVLAVGCSDKNGKSDTASVKQQEKSAVDVAKDYMNGLYNLNYDLVKQSMTEKSLVEGTLMASMIVSIGLQMDNRLKDEPKAKELMKRFIAKTESPIGESISKKMMPEISTGKETTSKNIVFSKAEKEYILTDIKDFVLDGLRLIRDAKGEELQQPIYKRDQNLSATEHVVIFEYEEKKEEKVFLKKTKDGWKVVLREAKPMGEKLKSLANTKNFEDGLKAEEAKRAQEEKEAAFNTAPEFDYDKFECTGHPDGGLTKISVIKGILNKDNSAITVNGTIFEIGFVDGGMPQYFSKTKVKYDTIFYGIDNKWTIEEYNNGHIKYHDLSCRKVTK